MAMFRLHNMTNTTVAGSSNTLDVNLRSMKVLPSMIACVFHTSSGPDFVFGLKLM
jgi:hypothetical protein